MKKINVWLKQIFNIITYNCFPLVPGQPTIYSKRGLKALAISDKYAKVSVGTNITTYDNVTIHIYCNIKAFPKDYSMEWTKEGSVDPKSAFANTVKTEPTLILENIVVEDSGIYYCNVKSPLGGDRQVTQLKVNGMFCVIWLNCVCYFGPWV